MKYDKTGSFQVSGEFIFSSISNKIKTWLNIPKKVYESASLKTSSQLHFMNLVPCVYNMVCK